MAGVEIPQPSALRNATTWGVLTTGSPETEETQLGPQMTAAGRGLLGSGAALAVAGVAGGEKDASLAVVATAL